MAVAAQARERRVTRRLEARGLKGLGQALVKLRGTQIDGRWELGTLYATGAEGAVFLCHDAWDATQPVRVAKIALLPQGEGTELRCEGEGQVGGLIAAVGSRLVEAVGRKMLDEFFRKLGEQLPA